MADRASGAARVFALAAIALVLAVLLGACGASSGGGDAKQMAADAVAATVDCSTRHTTEIVEVAKLPQSLDPRDGINEPLRVFARGVCPRPANERIGGTAEERRLSMFQVLYFVPTDEHIADGARWMTCEVSATTDTKAQALPTSGEPFIGPDGLPDAYQSCYKLLNDYEHVPCSDKNHVLRLVHTLDVPGGKGTSAICKRRFPGQEMVGVYEQGKTSLEPGATYLGCLSFDDESLEKYSKP
jgi:hypothetical protein